VQPAGRDERERARQSCAESAVLCRYLQVNYARLEQSNRANPAATQPDSLNTFGVCLGVRPVWVDFRPSSYASELSAYDRRTQSPPNSLTPPPIRTKVTFTLLEASFADGPVIVGRNLREWKIERQGSAVVRFF
jgi:hypothetical protein